MAGAWLFYGMFLAAQPQKGHYAWGPLRASEVLWGCWEICCGGDKREKKSFNLTN